jgi:hypothetical protein
LRYDFVSKAAEFRHHAQECRRLAARMQASDERDRLLGMAGHWDELAKECAGLMRVRRSLGMDEGHADGGPRAGRRG